MSCSPSLKTFNDRYFSGRAWNGCTPPPVAPADFSVQQIIGVILSDVAHADDAQPDFVHVKNLLESMSASRGFLWLQFNVVQLPSFVLQRYFTDFSRICHVVAGMKSFRRFCVKNRIAFPPACQNIRRRQKSGAATPKESITATQSNFQFISVGRNVLTSGGKNAIRFLHKTAGTIFSSGDNVTNPA